MDPGLPQVRSYTPANPRGPFPFTPEQLRPQDAGNDSQFYAAPRFVTHIDDNAILHLRRYYEQALPRQGRLLDFCSSWVSHYPPDIEAAAASGHLDIIGLGMNAAELARNLVLQSWTVQDLNQDPIVRLRESATGRRLDAATCAVSIEYLTRPVEVLQSIRRRTNEGGKVHLIISNRCFPTKAVGRWLRVEEAARLDMVGDYLWWSGWRNLEIQTLVRASVSHDPLWVVRGENVRTERGDTG